MRNTRSPIVIGNVSRSADNVGDGSCIHVSDVDRSHWPFACPRELNIYCVGRATSRNIIYSVAVRIIRLDPKPISATTVVHARGSAKSSTPERRGTRSDVVKSIIDSVRFGIPRASCGFPALPVAKRAAERDGGGSVTGDLVSRVRLQNGLARAGFRVRAERAETMKTSHSPSAQ